MAVGAHPEPKPVVRPASARYLNRELSRLDFDERVLAMADDPRLPVLERVRFLVIFSQNLDDFFQVRVAGLKEQVLAAVALASPDGMSPTEQLKAIRTRVEGLVERQDVIYNREIVPALLNAGISIVRRDEVGKKELSQLHTVFREQIFPVLTPLAVDPGHPFPYISHLSLNLAVMVRDTQRKVQRFARVKVPPVLPRFIPLGEGMRFVPLEDVIALHLSALFPGMDIVTHHPFRVTRDGDLDDVDGDAEDLLAAIQTELRRRRRHARVVRLEVDPGISPEMLELLTRELELQPADVYQIHGLLDMGSLSVLTSLDRPDLKAEPWTPTTQPRLRGLAAEVPDLFAVLRAGDVLAHHPYDSFATSVEAFIDHASTDPDVLAIKQTLYRTSGPASPVVRALIRAAERGKQVVALVEIKARGDEQANIGWARALEEANVHVVYGLLGLKTHAKSTLVVRREGGHIQHYLHVSTGDYNPNTARIYEDISLLSSNSDLGSDVTELFNLLTGYSRQSKYRKLLVAPTNLRAGITRLIEREGVAGGRIIIKVNNLVDQEIIDALYAAAQRGAEIDLLVRSMCSLRPAVPGLSERIRVRSIVGQFLEHSRVFCFGNGGRPEYYLGSSDLMPRNLDRRVEVVVPVTDSKLCERLQQILDISLADDVLTSELGPDGSWHKVPTVRGLNSHERFKELALESAHGNASSGTPLANLARRAESAQLAQDMPTLVSDVEYSFDGLPARVVELSDGSSLYVELYQDFGTVTWSSIQEPAVFLRGARERLGLGPDDSGLVITRQGKRIEDIDPTETMRLAASSDIAVARLDDEAQMRAAVWELSPNPGAQFAEVGVAAAVLERPTFRTLLRQTGTRGISAETDKLIDVVDAVVGELWRWHH